jgi:hypothetical protein
MNFDWGNWLPPFDPQHSADNVADADDCVSESAVHIIETVIYRLTGKQVRYSPRALAKLAGTTLNGNDISTVINAIKKYGLIPYDLWPDLTDFTWDEYYAEIPQNVIEAGKDFLANWEVSAPITSADLSIAPIWLRVKAGSTFHFVEQFNSTEIFDSYLPAVKPITFYEPVASFQFTIKSKNKMPQISSQAKGAERRIVLQAASPEEWTALCAIFGKDPNSVDETVS